MRPGEKPFATVSTAWRKHAIPLQSDAFARTRDGGMTTGVGALHQNATNSPEKAPQLSGSVNAISSMPSPLRRASTAPPSADAIR